MRASIDRILGWSAGASVAAALLCTCWALHATKARAGYAAGDKPQVVSIPATVTRRPVFLIWIQTTCRWCTESIPFYNRLVSDAGTERVIFLGSQPVDLLRDYLNLHGLQDATVDSIGSQTTRFTGTPTILLVGSDGVVRRVWLGKLRKIEEDEVLESAK